MNDWTGDRLPTYMDMNGYGVIMVLILEGEDGEATTAKPREERKLRRDLEDGIGDIGGIGAAYWI